MKKTFRNMVRTGIALGLMTAALAVPAFAGNWANGTGANAARWWYSNGDGTYVKGEWKWIDGNNDGTAEYYYFDKDGWMAAGKTVGSHVLNANGQWTVNGVVRTKKTNGSGATGHMGVDASKIKDGGNGKLTTTQTVQPTKGAVSNDSFADFQRQNETAAG